ncbi:MAG: type VI secretion system protein TssA [Pirellulaceae bacterium]
MSSVTSDNPACEFDDLLAPLAGDNPAGDPKAYIYGLHEQLDELGREDDADDYDDATRPETLKKADWPGVADAARRALREQTKDLRVACHLIEAQTRIEGFAGLRSGLALLEQLVRQCWDRLNPPLDNDDPESRSAPLSNMLDDPIRGLCFPNLVRAVPLLGDAKHGCSTAEWEKLLVSKSPEDQQRLDAVVSSSDAERLARTIAETEGCLQSLQSLQSALAEHLGDAAPGFVYLRQAIEECGGLASQVRRQIAGESHEQSEQPAPSGGAHDADAAPRTGKDSETQTRLQAYQQIDAAAEVLRRLEPHSPVPYLVKRAVKLGRMPFPTLIKQLVREESVLTELYREFDISSAENAAADA